MYKYTKLRKRKIHDTLGLGQYFQYSLSSLLQTHSQLNATGLMYLSTVILVDIEIISGYINDTWKHYFFWYDLVSSWKTIVISALRIQW